MLRPKVLALALVLGMDPGMCSALSTPGTSSTGRSTAASTREPCTAASMGGRWGRAVARRGPKWRHASSRAQWPTCSRQTSAAANIPVSGSWRPSIQRDTLQLKVEHPYGRRVPEGFPRCPLQLGVLVIGESHRRG